MSVDEKQTVLIVNDSLLICEQIETTLREESTIICEAHSGLEAQEQLRQCQPDLILLDVVLPDADGYELHKILQDLNHKNAVIISLTPRFNDEDMVEGLSMGVYDYIKRFFVKKEFQPRIRAHLMQRKQGDDLGRQNRELHNNMEKLNYMVYGDGLTELYNRRYVMGDLMEDMRSCGQDEVETVFIMADIGDFKRTNDAYGHDAGDMALVCIANILESDCCRHKVIRWNGEGFFLTLFNVTKGETYEFSEKMRRQVEQFVIPYGDKDFFCTMTLGLHISHEQEGLGEGIDYADKALYYGKRHSKNRSVWYKEQQWTEYTMGYSESDALEMLEVYLLKTRQLNGQLSEIPLEAEKAGRFNGSNIHSVFRITHTIKSFSVMTDINGLFSLAHKLEDLFSYYRENMNKPGHPEPGLFDFLFATSDFITQELGQMNREDHAPGDTSVLEQMTDDFLGHVSRREEKDSGKGGKTQGEEEGKEELPVIPELFVSKSETAVNATLEEGCRMENVHTFVLIRSITGFCTLVETYPGSLERQGESVQYIEGHGTFIRFESGDKEKVLGTPRKGLFVAQYRVLADSQPQDTAATAQKIAPERENTDSRGGEFMEVRTERLDYLQNLISELLLQMQVLENELKRNGIEDLEGGLGRQISLLVGQIKRSVMEIHPVPVPRIVPELKRALRDICCNQKKETDLMVRCSNVEADKSVVDYVSEALLYILRNVVDYGIESPERRLAVSKNRKGKITFSTDNMVGEPRVTIGDDGRGIGEERVRGRARQKGLFASAGRGYDPQKIREFTLCSGFPTSEKATEYFGRGAGLDVVENIVEDVGGDLSIRSTIGQGSTFSISVPLNLTSIECMRFRMGQYRLSIPTRHVYHFLEYESFRGQTHETNGWGYILYEDRMMSLISFRGFYSLGGEIPERAILVYVKDAGKEGCLLIDSIHGQKRIMVKSLPASLGTGFWSRTGICGCNIMNNGRICAALDTEIIISRYEKEERYDGWDVRDTALSTGKARESRC